MKKIALLFPGQGSQYLGMGKKMCERYPVAIKVFEEASDCLKYDLKKLCFEGSFEELTKTEQTQPAILTMSYAMYKVYVDIIGKEPYCCAGNSLGEISALTCAGSIKFNDALKIVQQRGRFMQEAVGLGIGDMVSVIGIDKKDVESECKRVSSLNEPVVISNFNSNEQLVISGHCNAVKRVVDDLKPLGAKIIPLKVSAPFHSPLMESASVKLREELKKYEYNDMKWPIISNVNALPYENKLSIIDNLVNQMVEPVQWEATMSYLQKSGIDIAVELGPNKVLSDLMNNGDCGIRAFALDKEEDKESLMKYLQVNISPKIGTFIIKCMAAAVCTKNRNFDNDEYQKGVIEPYNRVYQIQSDLETNQSEPKIEHAKAALEMIKSVFGTKKVPVEEQQERLNKILEETEVQGYI